MGATNTQQGMRRRVTAAVIVLMFFVAYWPLGPYLEQMLSPAAFMIWVVLIIPAIVVLVFMYNAYKNIQLDEELEASSGGAD